MAKKSPTLKSVETIKHDADKRKNIPTAEHQSVLKQDDTSPHPLKYPRNTDLNPQLVWRGTFSVISWMLECCEYAPGYERRIG